MVNQGFMNVVCVLDARRTYVRPFGSQNRRGPTPVQSTAGSFAGKNCRNRVFSGLLTSETEGYRLFLPGKAATLALSGGLGEISGDRWTRMGHTYPLPGSMAPQGALCPKLARFTRGRPFGCALGKRACWGHRAPLGAILSGNG